MNKKNELVLPKNFTELTEEECINIRGGVIISETKDNEKK